MKNRINDYFVAAEGAFKKIGRILHDKRFVSFELSIKLWGKSGKPKQFSIEGRRSADGSWVQREPYLSVSQSDEALKERFAQIENRVRNYIATNTLDAQWSKLEGLIKKALHSGQYVDDLVNSEGFSGASLLRIWLRSTFRCPSHSNCIRDSGSQGPRQCRSESCIVLFRPGSTLVQSKDADSQSSRAL